LAVDPITGGEELVSTLLNKFLPDKSQKERDELAAVLQLTKAQTDANTAEAAQPGLHFRDGAGWVCVASFAISSLKAPVEWVAAFSGHPVTLPTVDTTLTYSMLIGLLGLGGMHTYQVSK